MGMGKLGSTYGELTSLSNIGCSQDLNLGPCAHQAQTLTTAPSYHHLESWYKFDMIFLAMIRTKYNKLSYFKILSDRFRACTIKETVGENVSTCKVSRISAKNCLIFLSDLRMDTSLKVVMWHVTENLSIVYATFQCLFPPLNVNQWFPWHNYFIFSVFTCLDELYLLFHLVSYILLLNFIKAGIFMSLSLRYR